MRIFFVVSALIFMTNFYGQNSYVATYKDTIRNIIASDKSDKLKVDFLNKLSAQYVIKSPIKAIEFSDNAFEIAVKSNDMKGKAFALLNLGTAYYFIDKYEKAFNHLNQSEQVFRVINDEDGLGMVFNAYGEIYTLQGKYGKAIKSLFISLKYFADAKDDKKLAKVNNNIGVIYRNLVVIY